MNTRDLIALAKLQQEREERPGAISGPGPMMGEPAIMGTPLSALAQLVQQTSAPVHTPAQAMNALAGGYMQNRQGQALARFRDGFLQIAQNQKLDPQTKMNTLASHIVAYGGNPEDFKDIFGMLRDQMNNQLEYTKHRQNMAAETYKNFKDRQNGSALSPSLQKAKDERVATLISMSEENPIKLARLDEAEGFLKSLPAVLQGRLGKINIKAMQEADPNNPILGQWQNLKSILTEAQLDYVTNTKGAVSDREMILFGQAVANDDLLSVARMAPQIKKLRNSIKARQNAAINTYKTLYGEDPATFARFSDVGAPAHASNTQNVAAQTVSGVPQAGQMFNGLKVVSVKRKK